MLQPVPCFIKTSDPRLPFANVTIRIVSNACPKAILFVWRHIFSRPRQGDCDCKLACVESSNRRLNLLSGSLLSGDCEDTEEGAPLSHVKSTAALLVKFFISEARIQRTHYTGIGVRPAG
ncbi:hypothetical protein MES5069_310101 [Mesorhizobium escarrei]|uniref:Uncharacterized protein n=1 Tax=Mesorhizobium escarrei TaxID=666018 RepID=A0ABN8JYT2_9HYPH|nr:hypothetical protein MES5069_310101 [Mesorhizobium escarrei]